MERVHLPWPEKTRLVARYAFHHIREQFLVVVPVCLYIILFQLVVLRWGLGQIGLMTFGIVCVFLGLAFFLEGIRIGPVPIGEIVGNTLPRKHKAPVILLFAFFLGMLASFGEPVLGTLQVAGAHIQRDHAPLLYDLLVGQPIYLVGTVALGVGIAVVIGTLRFLHGWSLKIIVLPLVVVAIVLTIAAANDPVLGSAIGLAWDTGAVIVGPVLCPLVLALGVGVCRATGKTDPTMAGFGMVGLISVVPIAAVVILTFGLSWAGLAGGKADPAAASASPAPVELSSLPAKLDFATYYPKVRTLAWPQEIPSSTWKAHEASLGPDDRDVLNQAYAEDDAGLWSLRSQVPPTVRSRLGAALAGLGYRVEDTPRAAFERVYQISVVDEAKLKGTIVRRDHVAPVDAALIKPLLVSMGWVDNVPLFVDSLVLGARAILPIFLFLFVVMLLLKQKGPSLGQIGVSLGFVVTGLTLFFFGLSVGLGSLGNQLGDRLPVAFLDYLPLFPNEQALFSTDTGKIIVILFAVVLGYGATLAEPAFNVLGQQVEDVTQGAFKKNLFSQAVALGVGIGAGLGILSLLYDINLLYLLLPPYVLLAILTVINREIFVNIAWDGGAVTTGPVTVPLKLAIGLSLSLATGAGEGFGVLALASAYPVLNILLLGLVLGAKKPVKGTV